jgi:hypothetical protein
LDDPENLVSVYRARNVTEAHFVKNLLLADEIDAVVSEENEPFAGVAVVPPDVLVHRKDRERAMEIVRQFEAHQVEHGEDGESE